MRPLRDRSIRTKLTLIALATAVVALLAAAGAFTSYELVTFRASLTRDLAVLGDVIASNSTAALTFDDPNAAKEALAALRAQKHVVSACIYGRDGRVFATYARDAASEHTWPARVTDSRDASDRGHLAVFRPVVLDDETIGTIGIRSDLGEMEERARRYGQIVALVLVGASLGAWMVATRLQRAISGPVPVSWASGLAGFSNWFTYQAPLSRAIRSARSW